MMPLYFVTDRTSREAAVRSCPAKRLLRRPPAAKGRILRWAFNFCNQRQTGRPPGGGDLPTPIPDAPIQTFFGGVHPHGPAIDNGFRTSQAADKTSGLNQGGFR